MKKTRVLINGEPKLLLPGVDTDHPGMCSNRGCGSVLGPPNIDPA